MDELQKRGPGRPPKHQEIKLDGASSTPPGYVEDVVGSFTELPQRKSKRVPFGTMDQSLAYEQRSGFHRHWFNDWSGRIMRAEEAGYEHVLNKEGKKVVKVVGTAEGGGPLHAYLMEIPEDWYQEDMAAQLREVDKREEGIKRNIAPQNLEGGTAQDAGKFYAGKEGSSIKRG